MMSEVRIVFSNFVDVIVLFQKKDICPIADIVSLFWVSGSIILLELTVYSKELLIP